MSAARVSRGARRLLTPLLGLVALALLAGCIPPLPEVNDLKEVQAGEVVLVGQVELVPPLTEAEREQSYGVDGNSIVFYVHSKPIPLANPIYATEREEFIEAVFDQTFYTRAPLRPTYFTVGLMQFQQGNVIERIWLGGGFYVDLKPGDQAVYMGTIRYHRNEYFDITKVELIDEYSAEQKAFARKFGSGAKLVKRLARSFKIPKEPEDK